jgi:hypothetical protein
MGTSFSMMASCHGRCQRFSTRDGTSFTRGRVTMGTNSGIRGNQSAITSKVFFPAVKLYVGVFGR